MIYTLRCKKNLSFFFKKKKIFIKTVIFFSKTSFFKNFKNILFFNKISNLIYSYSKSNLLSIFYKNILLMVSSGILLKFLKIERKPFKKKFFFIYKFVKVMLLVCQTYYINILHNPLNLRTYLLKLNKRIIYNNYLISFYVFRKKNRRIKRWLSRDYIKQNKQIL